MKKTAVIYARVSDKKQVENDVSLPSQLDEGYRRAETLNAEVIRVFEERGRSAWRGYRPEFSEAVEYCELNQIDYFITWDTARFSRNSVNGPVARHRLRAAGTRIEYIILDINPDTDEGFVLEAVYQMTDELKSRQTSVDTARSMMRNAREGYFNGGRTPYGFQAVVAPDNPKRKRLAINEVEAIVVKEIFELRLQGMGGKAIAGVLNERDLKNRIKRWNKASVTSLLRNQTVIGNTVFNRKNHVGQKNPPEDWVIVPSHPAIIDQSTWEAVQKMMDAAKNPTNEGSPLSEAVFTGMLKCGKCGASMQTETAGGRSKRYKYYNCRSAQKLGECEHRRIRVDQFDPWLTEQIMDTIITPELMAEIIDEMHLVAGDWAKNRRKEMDALNREIDRQDGLRSKLYDIMESDDDVNLGDLVPRIRKYNEQILSLERQYAKLESEKPPKIKITRDQSDEMASIFRDLIANSDNVQRTRSLFSSFIEEIQVQDDNIHILYNPASLVVRNPEKPVHRGVEWLPESTTLGTRAHVIDFPEYLPLSA